MRVACLPSAKMGAAALAEGLCPGLPGAISFLPTPSDSRTFHQRALEEEAGSYEERVGGDLSNLVFGQVFPELARAIATAAPAAPLQEVREAALILLYPPFVHSVCQGQESPVSPNDARYDDYGLRGTGSWGCRQTEGS